MQTLLLGSAVLLAAGAQWPGAALAGIGVLWIALVVAEVIPVNTRETLGAARLMVVWTASAVVALHAVAFDFFCAVETPKPLASFRWYWFYAGPAWLIAGAIWLAQRRMLAAPARERWKAPVLAWLFCGALVGLEGGYVQNLRGEFCLGLLATLAALVIWRAWFRFGSLGAQTVHTLILLAVGLPVADWAMQYFALPALRPETCRFYYSYDAAKSDPAAFHRWTAFYNEQFSRMGKDIFMPAPNSPLPWRLRPNSHGFLMNCPISINSRGFRGREFSLNKGDTYRIVALGESTTFGMTLQTDDKPWPELLEQLIRQRLKPRRPIEVINAGVSSYSINNNLYRMSTDILPLKPDLIISYHGANGFNLIDGSLLPPTGPPVPVYAERPLKLAAQAEYRLKMMLYRRGTLRSGSAAPTSTRPMDSEYAAAYRQLIECARTNGIRLALANFSMGLNTGSESSVIEFYRGGGTGETERRIQANAVHSRIVARLAAEYPEVCFVDTHPHLDGEHEKFIDLFHFTQEGRRQLAENMYAGIRNILEKDLGER
jgi:lysophospholipase L1-like esterase